MQNTSPTSILQPQLSFVQEGHVRFTPAQAKLVIDWCRYEFQRDESRAGGHIATLAEDMRRGNWLPKSQLDFARLDGRLTLVNGHHRMRAQIESQADILWNIAIHECDSKAAVKSLYYRFDTNLRKRTAANIMGGIGFADEVGLKKDDASSLWKSAQVIADGMKLRQYINKQSNRALLTDERIAICHEFAAEAAAMGKFISLAPGHMRPKMRSVSTFSVALVTLKAEPEIANSFWKGLAEDDGLAKGDPRKTLLLDMQTRRGRAGLMASGMMAAARAWNAYRAGKELQIIKVTGHAVRIEGTQYTVQS